ncbi:MAG TPA: branched-chain amino acid ABC transporter permease [Nocardioidaceae bacterium]|jgi:branched-subunit amino acid ABC-type transport system permease component|nr:branched-chain amino acid ABC transporter permease [Nocardioidaceae bacterium]
MLSWLDANALTMINGVALAAVLFLIAVGLSLIFGTMNVLNLAHGAVSLTGAYIGVALLDGSATMPNFIVAVLAAAAVGLVIGGVLAVMTSSVKDHLRQALLTLGVALIAGDVLREIFGADVESVPAPAGLDGAVSILGRQYPLYRLSIIAVSAVIAILLYLVLERTRVGAMVRATVADRAMVEAIGIRTNLVLGGVFGVGAALASIGGLLAAPILGAQPGLDDTVLLLGLVVVVVGGLGSLKGALVGALLVGQLQTLGVALLSEYASFLLFGAMALVLLTRPRGLLPAKTGAH